ncbi:MAG: MobA/MobL family protein [Comamonas sp.]|uniref:MobA/MobL family protein n=1 Tax=Comamonas sp. TaxID=34028 RepID=UPI0026480BC2|nr:MobA/MobL family protein [Comamonas sp.]MDN5502878.1 MobA/MobL family protein [Comamonas sp.]MDN5539084.1 MobA/MobL family protein [Comamonas sp.]
MAIYHFTTKVHGRADNPKLHALRALAYRAAKVIDLPDIGRKFNYWYKKKEVVATETMLPKYAPSWMNSAIDLWGHVEDKETRDDAQIFREIEAALPIELSLEQQIEIVRRFIEQEINQDGMCATYAIHDKPGNPHVHIMLTMRELTPEGTFGKKNRAWNDRTHLQGWRDAWEKHVNDALAAAGCDARISAKAYKDTNPDLKPTVHLGPVHVGRKDAESTNRRARRVKRNERIVKSNRLATTYRMRANVGEATPENLRADALAESLIGDLSSLATEVQADIPSSMTPEEAAAYTVVVSKVPNAEAVFAAMEPVRTAMGRVWNWSTFASLSERLDMSKDGFHALLCNELMFFAKRRTTDLMQFSTLVEPGKLLRAVTSVRAKVQFFDQAGAQELGRLQDSLRSYRIAPVAPQPVIAPVVPVPVVPQPVVAVSPQLDNAQAYREALGSFAHLVHGLEGMVQQLTAVSTALGRKFNPEVLTQRITRIEREELQPPSQQALMDELWARDFAYAVRKTPERVAAGLAALPVHKRALFETVVIAIAASGDSSKARQDVAAGLTYTVQSQHEIQAQWSLRAVLSPFQLKDYDDRAGFMKSLGMAYAWVDFQKDIQRLAEHGDGWQRAWWREQVDSSFGEQATSLMACLPAWYYGGEIKVADMPKSYPLGHYNPPPVHDVSMHAAPPEHAHAVVEPEPAMANVISVNGMNMEADTLEDIERIGIEWGCTVDMVNRFKLAYWQSRGEEAWFDALGMHLRQYDIDLASRIRNPELCQFGQQLPEDVAYRTALNMGRIQPVETHGIEAQASTPQWASPGMVSTTPWAPRQTPRPSPAPYPYSLPDTPFPSLAPKGTDAPV